MKENERENHRRTREEKMEQKDIIKPPFLSRAMQ